MLHFEVGIGTFFTLVSGSSNLGKPFCRPMTTMCCRGSYGSKERLAECDRPCSCVLSNVSRDRAIMAVPFACKSFDLPSKQSFTEDEEETVEALNPAKTLRNESIKRRLLV